MTPSSPSSKPNEGASRAATDSLRGRAVRAAAFVLGAFGTLQALRLLANVILTRLLYPEAFGLMGLVLVFLIGLHLFSDIGIGPSVVQSERGSDASFLNTAWTIQVVRGVLLWLVGLALSYPFAAFYDDPRLGPLLFAANTTSLITGFQSTKINLADRNLDQRRLAMLDLTCHFVGIAVTIGLAYAFRSIWALVAGSLTTDVVRTVMSHLWLPGPSTRFNYEPAHARSLVRFGKWIFLSTLLSFVVTQCDRLLFGKLVDRGTFGVYQTGANIAAVVPMALAMLASRILFPVYSRIVHSGGDIRRIAADVRRPVLVTGGFLLSCLAAGGPLVIRILYDARYHAAGWVVQLLAVGAWFALVESTNTHLLLATGRSSLMAAANASKLLGIVACVSVGYAHFGFPGAVGGYAAADACKYLFSAAMARKLRLANLPQDVTMTAWFAVSTLVGVAWVDRAGAWTESDLVAALLLGGVVAACWAPWAFALRASHLASAPGARVGAAPSGSS